MKYIGQNRRFYPIPHLFLAPRLGWPQWNFAKTFGKLESLSHWTISCCIVYVMIR